MSKVQVMLSLSKYGHYLTPNPFPKEMAAEPNLCAFFAIVREIALTP